MTLVIVQMMNLLVERGDMVTVLARVGYPDSQNKPGFPTEISVIFLHTLRHKPHGSVHHKDYIFCLRIKLELAFDALQDFFQWGHSVKSNRRK